MTDLFEYGAIAEPTEVQRLKAILAQCFNSPSSDDSSYFSQIGVENFRGIRQAGQLAGGLAQIAMGQWWGGQCVPMTGIAAVGIAPEYRGSGAAIALMQHIVQELYDQGVALSALYPAVQRLYRKAGYEQGGTLSWWEISPASIQIKARLPIHRVEPKAETFVPLYRQQAQANNGYLDRAPAIWKELLKSDQKTDLFAYMFGEIGQPQGYVIFSQERIENNCVLRVRDYVTLTPEAGRTFWAFMASHRSQTDQVRWKGSAIELLTLLLPEQTVKARLIERWMLRIIDVAKALEKRGYPVGAQTELHLEIQDDLLPGNNGRFILSVANEQGTVTKGGQGALKLDIRALAPLYTGLFSPAQLQLAGKLEATEAALQAATQLFVGSSPWMPDFF